MTLEDYNGSSGGRVDNLEPSTNVLGTGEGTYKGRGKLMSSRGKKRALGMIISEAEFWKMTPAESHCNSLSLSAGGTCDMILANRLPQSWRCHSYD